MSDRPKWTRRKEARPTEIVDAAMEMFMENGFAGTTLTEVAKRAGVVKGTLYIYFETKEDLFRAAARRALATNLDAIERMAIGFEGSVTDLLPMLLQQAAVLIGDSRLPAIVRMVISESRAFPDLASIWHDEVVSQVLGLLTKIVGDAQARGEIRQGDPKLFAISIVGPIVMGMLFREVFGAGSPHAPDLPALARQHSETILQGILIRKSLEARGSSNGQ